MVLQDMSWSDMVSPVSVIVGSRYRWEGLRYTVHCVHHAEHSDSCTPECSFEDVDGLFPVEQLA